MHALEKPIKCTGERLEEETQKNYHLDILAFTTETHHYIGVTDATIQTGDSIYALLEEISVHPSKSRRFLYFRRAVVSVLMHPFLTYTNIQ